MTDIRPGTYTVDAARSAVRFTATHVLGIKPVDGTMTVRAGTVVVAGEARRSTVSAEIDATSWKTDDAKRDRDVRGPKFLDVQAHPVIGFRSTRLAHGSAGWQIAGELSVRGGSCEVTLRLTDVQATVDGYLFTAVARVDRVAAGITSGRAIIGRHLDVTLTVCVTG